MGFFIKFWLLLTVGDVITAADIQLKQGYGLHTPLFAFSTKAGRLQCVKMCLATSSCLSVNYFRHALLCLLNDGNKDTYPEDYLPLPGSSYGDRTDFGSNFGGPCLCPHQHTCINLTVSRKKTCVITECGNYPSLTNGEMSSISAGRRVGSVLTFKCNSGYLLAGKSTKTCKASGQWTSDALSCIDCGDPPPVANAGVHPGSNTISSSRAYSCNQGYIQKQGTRTITCQSNAQWTSPDLECSNLCTNPPSKNNADVDAQTAVIGNYVTYTCRQGYTTYHGRRRHVTCGEDLQWKGYNFQCQYYSTDS